MKKMIIFDPAMCCSTGVCGPSVNKELLRVSVVLNSLEKNGIVVERYNLSNAPQMFIDNKVINELINKHGVDVLPVTIVDEEVVKTKEYPSNKEFCELLNVSEDLIKAEIESPKKVCNCKNGCC
ncbi:arsenite efflux transporter metallochaperone ArsD [Clostridium paraputrificum]|uniref:arsenite efflux transporter metallochaperone ArsD n=1 Tax=Clostridium paraputrificum TaxID=29363 RepID=UPI003D324A30